MQSKFEVIQVQQRTVVRTTQIRTRLIYHPQHTTTMLHIHQEMRSILKLRSLYCSIYHHVGAALHGSICLVVERRRVVLELHSLPKRGQCFYTYMEIIVWSMKQSQCWRVANMVRKRECLLVICILVCVNKISQDTMHLKCFSLPSAPSPATMFSAPDRYCLWNYVITLENTKGQWLPDYSMLHQ